jgi:hypothetical protein
MPFQTAELVPDLQCAAGMLQLGQDYFGLHSTERLRVHCVDGIDFVGSAPDNSIDVLILDVAETAQATLSSTPGSAALTGPTPAFLGAKFLDGAVWSKLNSDAVLAVNVLGGADVVASMERLLQR